MIAAFKEVKKAYGKKTVLNDMSFEIHGGEIVGLLGPNGSGKTTAMKLLSGMIYPDSGEISLDCKFRSLIETPRFYNALSGRDNLLYFAALDKMGEQQVEKVVETLEMGGYIRRRAGQYSLGMKQKLGLACALLGDPELLILDEPINGLDPLAVVQTREIFRKIRGEHGAAILISSHILQEMQELCDRVLLIKEGKIIASVAVGNAEPCYVFTFYSEDDVAAALNLLGDNASVSLNTLEIVVRDFQPIYKTVSYLTAQGLRLTEVRKKNTDLEEVYCNYFKSD